jgi:hypothetical protein
MATSWAKSSLVTFLLALACKHAPPPDCSALSPRAHATYGPSSAFGEPSCAMICQPGWLDCDENETNGCETSTVGLTPHTVIELGAFTRCATSCERGWYDCDEDMRNGCEQHDACPPSK